MDFITTISGKQHSRHAATRLLSVTHLGERESTSFPIRQPSFSKKSPRSLLFFDQQLFFTAGSEAQKL